MHLREDMFVVLAALVIAPSLSTVYDLNIVIESFDILECHK